MPFDDDMVAKDCAGKVATLVSLFGQGGGTTRTPPTFLSQLCKTGRPPMLPAKGHKGGM
jgi:hypothetical protein